MSKGQLAPPGADSPLSFAISERERNTVSMVRDAVAANRVMLAFQPVMPARQSGRPAFWEGLIRLMDAHGRIIPAREFISIVETAELGRRIDCLALRMGLQTLARHPDLRLSINMSARSIGYPKWMEVLQSGLAADPTVAERLILEITESSAMLMPDTVHVFMTEMQTHGISFALDDFGAGYTAFRYFRDFFFDILKIDGQFIRDIHRDTDNQVLTQALLSIAQHFDMFTVAEFVETAEDAEFLSRIGVDCMQGYFFGAPTVRPAWVSAAAERSEAQRAC